MLKFLTCTALTLATGSASAQDLGWSDNSNISGRPNTIAVPPVGYYKSGQLFTHDDLIPEGVEVVALTKDGKPGVGVCDHFISGPDYGFNIVILDKMTLKSTNVRDEYTRDLCLEEGRRIAAGHAPQNLDVTARYVSRRPGERIGGN